MTVESVRSLLGADAAGYATVGIVLAAVSLLVFHAPGHDHRRFLELFERDLAPRLRKLP